MDRKIETLLDFEVELLKMYVNYRIEEFTKVELHRQRFWEEYKKHGILIYDEREVFTMSFEDWRPYGEFMLCYNQFWVVLGDKPKRKITDINEAVFVMNAAQTNRNRLAKIVNRYSPLTPEQSFLINQP